MKEFLQELNLIIQRLEVLIIGHKLQITEKKEVNILKTKLVEFGLGIDFNFFEFDVFESSLQMTPYISTGISYFLYDALRYEQTESKAIKYADAYNIVITHNFRL